MPGRHREGHRRLPRRPQEGQKECGHWQIQEDIQRRGSAGKADLDGAQSLLRGNRNEEAETHDCEGDQLQSG